MEHLGEAGKLAYPWVHLGAQDSSSVGDEGFPIAGEEGRHPGPSLYWEGEQKVNAQNPFTPRLLKFRGLEMGPGS